MNLFLKLQLLVQDTDLVRKYQASNRLRHYMIDQLQWVICGAETGQGKRPMDIDFALSICEQCDEAEVPFFFKKDSNGLETLDGKTYHEFPE